MSIATYSQAGACMGFGRPFSNNPAIMGTFVNGRWSNFFGGAALVLMTVAAGVLIYFWL